VGVLTFTISQFFFSFPPAGRSRDDNNDASVRVTSVPSRSKIYGSCSEARAEGFSNSGTYEVSTGGGLPTSVFCDMTIAGGGWTLVGHSKASGNWPDVEKTFLSTSDNFNGYGTYSSSWEKNTDYSRSVVDIGGHDEVLFMTGNGNKWCVLLYSDLVRNSNNDDTTR